VKTEHDPLAGARRCACRAPHRVRLIAVTGGPGAGKTALLEVARRHYCPHVVVLPESATIVYGGGFPRREAAAMRRHAQLAILHVQDQLERTELESGRAALVLCDRSLVDGLAYWPDDEASYLRELHTTRAELLERYDAVLHLRPPRAGHGYDHENRVRIESAREAALLDRKIESIYEGHPHRHFVEGTDDFLAKLLAAIAWLDRHVPSCCRLSATATKKPRVRSRAREARSARSRPTT
jgi:predicted ATPase